MGFQILRTKKLKQTVSVLRSLKHSHREQETLNADPSKRGDNGVLIGAGDANAVLQGFKQLLPEKIRKGGVLCIEYLVTASPESMQKMTKAQQDEYFNDAVKWLQERHGAKNVIHAGVHRDETTPHMFAYVMPYDSKGKMNASAFLGGSEVLSKMQTDFHQKVSQKYGLERGVKGSKAKHQRVKRHYAQLNEPDPKIGVTAAEIKPEKKGIFKQESHEAVAERVSRHLQRKLQPVVTRAKTAQGDKDRAREMARTAKILGEKNEVLSQRADFWEDQNRIFLQDLAPEDQEELRTRAEELRIGRQEKNYLALVKEHPEQLRQINDMYKNKGIRLIGRKDNPTPASITEQPDTVEISPESGHWTQDEIMTP